MERTDKIVIIQIICKLNYKNQAGYDCRGARKYGVNGCTGIDRNDGT